MMTRPDETGRAAMAIEQTFVDSIKGFLDAEEGRGLYAYALQAARYGPCLEIGSYCGKSTVYLGTACRQRDTVLFAVDHHGGSEEQQPGQAYFDPDLLDARTGRIDTFAAFRTTLDRAGLKDTVVPIVSSSATAARCWATPLSLVFIDGGHAFETVLADYRAWAGHVMAGGFLLFHDIFTDPSDGGLAPYRVYRRALASGLFEARAMIKTLGVLQRKADGTLDPGLLA